MSLLHPTLREPDIQIVDAILDLWKRDHLEIAIVCVDQPVAEPE